MSTLNRTSSMLDSMIFEGRKPTAEDIAAERGLPEKILKQTLEDINRHLDYMRGFKPLASWFDDRAERLTIGIPLVEWYEESGLAEKNLHCICVASIKVGSGSAPLIPSEQGRYKRERCSNLRDGTQRVTWLRVFLTRKLDWIVWMSWPVSVFRLADSMNSMLALVEELRPAEMPLFCYDQAGRITDTEVHSVPILVTAELQLHLERSLIEKRKEADREEATLAIIKRRTDVYARRYP